MTATPGDYLPGGIVLIDEPAGVGLSTFASNGEVLMSFSCRPGGSVSQVIMGLTPNQAMQLIEKLQKHSYVYERAIAEGKGGACFPEAKP